MTRRALKYFMWGYQEHFTHSMESRAKGVLNALGVDMEVKGGLIGVRLPDATNGHDVCFVPEDYFSPDVFSSCHRRTEEIFSNHPDHNLFYGDEPSMRDKPENIRRQSVRQAVEEALESYNKDHGTVSFCGMPMRVSGYHVVPALLIPLDSFLSIPHLPTPIVVDRWTSRTSIAEAVMHRLLTEASEGLGGKEPGRFSDEFRGDTSGLLRQAADNLCSAITLATKDFMFQGVFQALNEISAMKYEGGDTNGSILFSPTDTTGLDLQITFLKPTPLTSARLARKLVEMSGDDLACVCTGSDGISGLGSLRADSVEPVFRAVFTGHYRWELLYGTTRLMDCAYGVPSLPSPRLSESAFVVNVRRVLPDLTESQAQVIWGAVSAAMQQEHGTMLVISNDAGSEAERLINQGIAVQPIALGPDLVHRISGVDGAILIDPDCRCHALGVILDGMAAAAGDASRGARFNSAVRYVGSATAPTLCIVVSEDGYIDMIPTLRPQVSRDEVESHVNDLCSLTSEDYHHTRTWLDQHRFYLTPEQCDIVNAELARIHSEPQEVGTIRIGTQPFVPHPEMNETYYLDSEPDAS